jgi:xanthine/CO dehydrogenase XdhC/CoxF family maturation factor
MKELRAILDAVAAMAPTGRCGVLATLVKAEGSTYRRPGARMLMTGDGGRVGSISGGCLESDLCRRCQTLRPGGKPVVVTYSTVDDSDAFLGYALGCKGKVAILLEHVDPANQSQHLRFIRECLDDDRVGVLATVYGVDGTPGLEVGSRLMLSEADAVTTGTWPADLAEVAGAEAKSALRGGQSHNALLQSARGRAEVFVEIIRPSVRLVIFGAGDSAAPLVRLAKELGWHVTVCDRRPAYADAERFPPADAVIVSAARDIPERLRIGDRTVAVVMTHNYPEDLELLRVLLPSAARYVGLLGSRQRTERLIHDLAGDGLVLADEQLERLHGPVGLDIGADTPEEIALSIIAEIQAALAHRPGGPLRDRRGPIHAEPAPTSQTRAAVL